MRLYETNLSWGDPVGKQVMPPKWALASGFLLLFLASCDNRSFSGSAPSTESAPVVQGETDDGSSQSAPAVPAPAESVQPESIVQVGGVPGGHFDLDTSIASYAFNQGTTVQHVHEYDDKYNVTAVDYFKLLDPKFVDPTEALTADQSFKIIVANAQLSPGARISINGQSYPVTDWQKRSQSGDLPLYSLSGVAGTQKLTSFLISFNPAKSIADQLIPSQTNLVRSNAPGPGQTYRAGALTVQMIDTKIGQIDPTLGVSLIGAPGLLWESTLFWHVEK